MPSYIVTRKSDGVEVYRYDAPAPIEWVGMEFATHNHSEAGAGGLPPAPVSVYGGRRIPVRSFTRRYAWMMMTLGDMCLGGIGVFAGSISISTPGLVSADTR